MLPKFLGDERHEGMQHLHELLKEAERAVHRRLVNGQLLTIDVRRLNHLQIPGTELIPEQAIDRHQCLRDAIGLKLLVHQVVGLLQFGLEPGDSLTTLLRLGHISHGPTLHQTEGIPNLVVEVAALLTE